MKIKKIVTFICLSSMMLTTACGTQKKADWMTSQSWTAPTSEFANTQAAPEETPAEEPVSTEPAEQATTESAAQTSAEAEPVAEEPAVEQAPVTTQEQLYSSDSRLSFNSLTIVSFDRAGESIACILPDQIAEMWDDIKDNYLMLPHMSKVGEQPDKFKQYTKGLRAGALELQIGVILADADNVASEEISNFADTFSADPSYDNMKKLLTLIKKENPAAYKELMKQAPFNAKSAEEYESACNEMIVEYMDTIPENVLDSLELYDMDGNFLGTYSESSIADLQNLINRNNAELKRQQEEYEKSVTKIEMEKDKVYNLSSMEEGKVYRYQSKETEGTFSICNDLNGDIIYTHKDSFANKADNDYLCYLSITDRDGSDKTTTSTFASTEPYFIDVSWTPASKDKSLTDYGVPADKIVYISKLKANTDSEYPSGSEYIYNDTDSPVVITVTDSTAPVNQGVEIPAHTAATCNWAYVEKFQYSQK